MRVASYARVSSLRQEAEGQSLINQERAFVKWSERTGHTRVRAYRESASGGTIEGREEFSRMLGELPMLKVDAVIIDAMDRFTRNLRDGLNLIEELRTHGVGLLPIDWHRETPLDLRNDRDWADVVDEFTTAEAERRRIAKRIRRAYEGRRERGATLTNKAPFGLRKDGDQLVPDKERAWIITEIDAKFLAGEKLAHIAAFVRTLDPKAPKTFDGVRTLFENHSFVVAGLRSAETQCKLDAILKELTQRFGRTHRHVHEFAGVFLCGPCSDLNQERRMSAVRWNPPNKPKSFLICPVKREISRISAHAKRSFSIGVERIAPLWRKVIEELSSDETVIDKWAAHKHSEAKDPRHKLEQRLAKIDQEAARIKARRDAAFDLLISKTTSLKAQARKMLEEIESDEAGLAAQRAIILGELATVRPVKRNAAELRTALAAYRAVYNDAPTTTKNRLNRALCIEFGSFPRIYRDGAPRTKKTSIRLEWPDLGITLRDEGFEMSAETRAKISQKRRARVVAVRVDVTAFRDDDAKRVPHAPSSDILPVS